MRNVKGICHKSSEIGGGGGEGGVGALVPYPGSQTAMKNEKQRKRL